MTKIFSQAKFTQIVAIDVNFIGIIFSIISTEFDAKIDTDDIENTVCFE